MIETILDSSISDYTKTIRRKLPPKKIKAICPCCETSGLIPESYRGEIQCPKCRSKFNRPGVPISLSRQMLLDTLANIEKVGLSHVQWLTARDEYVCGACKNREGKDFTISQMKDILGGLFCDSYQFEQSCRCAIIR